PWVVKIRDYEVVLLPSRVGAVGPFKESPLSYHAGERRIATTEEYYAACDKLARKRPFKSEVALTLESTRANLQAANEDSRHWQRLYDAGLAAKSYAALFLISTRATTSVFAQFC